MRILTWNLHKGVHGGRLCLPGIRALLGQVDADVVCLQEVVGSDARLARRHAQWPVQGFAAALADAHHQVYGATREHRHGDHGNALLSRWPVLAIHHLDLHTNPLERRRLLHAVINVEAQPLHALVMHLGLTGSGRAHQIARIAAYIADLPTTEPVILAGDSNDWRRRASAPFAAIGLQEVHRALGQPEPRSFPAAWPLLALDRIYVRGLQARSAGIIARDHAAGLSDHLPVLAEVELIG